ncbi:MAG: hypothetical protein ACI4VF_02795 [Lachnospirales bacterium]
MIKLTMDKKKKIAIIAVVIIVFCGIIYACSLRPEYDEFGNMIETTTFEEITEETTTFEYTTEETTDIIRPTETTTEEPIDVVIIPNSTPDAIVDSYILYDDKRLAVNFSLDSFKAVLGNPIVFMEEETEITTFETESESVTEEETETTTEAVSEDSLYYDSYRYREFILFTKLEDNKEIVKDIEVISNKINNLSGFSPIDKPLYEITLAYGEPDYSDWAICKYNIDENSYLYFKLSNGVVATWGIASN